MGDFGVTRDKWVCPNDRELSLRAKLRVGWSVKTNSNNFNKPDQLNDTEQEVIMNVIRRAELLDKVEQERVGRLVERLDNMKRNAMGNGSTQCILCADEFGILGASPLLCHDCRKAVCTKCGVDTVSAQKEPLWLCKICAETRETWKKSGAWFYKGLPKYVLPGKKGEQGKYSTTTPSTPPKGTATAETYNSPARPFNSWLQSKGRSGSERDFTDSSDDEIKTSRLAKKAAVRKPYVDSVDNPDSSVTTQYTVAPPTETTTLGPSPTHLYSPTPDTPHSPRSPLRETPDKSPGYETSPTYGRERRTDSDRSHPPTASGSYWYKPNARREAPEEEEYVDRSSRGHPKRDGHHPPSSRHRPVASNREQQSCEDKASPEESSKKQSKFYKRKKRKKN